MKIKVNDNILVITGKNKGKSGKVLRSSKSRNEWKITVEGINIVKKAVKASENQKGGFIELEKPISCSNVMLICPNCNKTTRVEHNDLKGKDKKRACKKCKKVIDQPFTKAKK